MKSNPIRYEHRREQEDIAFRDDKGGKIRLQCGLHLHHELELVYLMEGETRACADTCRVTLHPGDVFIAFPNQIHYYETVQREKYMLFIIKPESVPEFLDLFTMSIPTSPVVVNARELPHIHQLFVQLFDSCTEKQHPYADSRRKGYLLALFAELIPHLSVSQLSMSDSGALRSIVSFCTRHFSEDLSLSVLEEKLHLNKYYISHLFSSRLGIRFNDYINSLRVLEACRYLLNTNYSVTEISEMVGFNTLRTFNRSFIKQLGVSPSEYRKNDEVPARAGTSTKIFIQELKAKELSAPASVPSASSTSPTSSAAPKGVSVADDMDCCDCF